MEIVLIADPASVASSHGLGLALRANFPTSNLQFSPSSDSCSAHGGLQISAVLFPVDAVAPPPTKPRTRLRRKRVAKRRSLGGDDSDGAGDSIEDWFFGGDGPIFGGGGGGGGEGFGNGGGGGGWNFGGFGGQNWNESSSSPSDPAFDFVYEVISWIALSNCVHFAFKKVLRAVAEREKVVPMRLTSVC